jgi:hypothetical protein
LKQINSLNKENQISMKMFDTSQKGKMTSSRFSGRHKSKGKFRGNSRVG